MEIRIASNGEKDCTEVVVDMVPEGEAVGIRMRWRCGSQTERVAVQKLLTEDLAETVETMVRDAYEQGWRDRRSKRRKRTGFTNFLRHPSDLSYTDCW